MSPSLNGVKQRKLVQTGLIGWEIFFNQLPNVVKQYPKQTEISVDTEEHKRKNEKIWMNEWMNERMNERMNEWMNEWMNERMNEWKKERMNE